MALDYIVISSSLYFIGAQQQPITDSFLPLLRYTSITCIIIERINHYKSLTGPLGRHSRCNIVYNRKFDILLCIRKKLASISLGSSISNLNNL